ncbi:MAG: P-loop NTPase fold protein [Myxococcota bacterium]
MPSSADQPADPRVSLRALVVSLGLTPGFDLVFVQDAVWAIVAQAKEQERVDPQQWLQACVQALRSETRRALAAAPDGTAADPSQLREVLAQHRTRFAGRPVDALSLLHTLQARFPSFDALDTAKNKAVGAALVLPESFELSRSAQLLLADAVELDRGRPTSADAATVRRVALRSSNGQYHRERLRDFLARASVRSQGAPIHTAALLQAAHAEVARIPGFHTESLDGEDLLDIERDVHGLASLVAAKSVLPPLSIGLFGPWGSGKSFFMRKLRARIDALAEATTVREQTGLDSSFHGHVVQIEFNAWNYIEVDLWASLVTHIFEQLHRHFVPRKTEREQWYQLLRELDDAEEERGEAERALEDAETALAEAKAKFESLQLSLLKRIDVLWQAIAADPETDAALKAQLEALHEDLDADAARDLLRKVAEHRENFEHIRPHLPGYWRIAANNLWYVVGIAVVASAILALLATVVLYGLSQLPEEQAWALEFWGRLLEAAVPVMAAATAIRQTVTKAASIAARVEAIREQAVKEVDEAKQRRPEALRLAEAENGLAKAKAEADTQSKRVAELRGAERRLRPNERLAAFLEDRAASDDYRKYLGLPAMIRRDFEKLHRLLGELREQTFALEADASLWPTFNSLQQSQ